LEAVLPRYIEIAPLRRLAAALAVAAMLFASSCAYYNTFFDAQKYYKQAERSRTDRTENTPTAVEISNYEKCIRQCSKVIADYPNSKYVDDAMHLMAESFFYWGRYEEAMKWYKQQLESYPASELTRDSRFMIARCHIELGEYVDAENALTELLTTAKPQEAVRIEFALSEVAVQRGETDEAVRHLRALLEGKASSRMKLDAYMGLGDAYFAEGAYDSAAISYEEVAKGSDKQEERVDARTKMGKAWQARGDYEKALDIYSQLLLSVDKSGKKKGDVREATLLLRMGECYNSLGDNDKALELFDRVMEDFPKTASAAEAEFLTGYTYEIYLEDIDRAKISYDRVPSHFARSVFVDEAERRSEGLGKLKQYLDEGGTKTEIEGEPTFLSAELNLFQLNKPQKALELYREVEASYPDSPLAPKAAYAAAWVLVNKLDKADEGMAEYRRVVEEYPYSDYAEGARRILGIEALALRMQGPPVSRGWTPPDSAALAAVRAALLSGSADSTAAPAPARAPAPGGGLTPPDSGAAGRIAGLDSTGDGPGHAAPDSSAGGVPDTVATAAPPDSSAGGMPDTVAAVADSSSASGAPARGGGDAPVDSSGAGARADSSGAGANGARKREGDS
jgi:TolA-binding protein